VRYERSTNKDPLGGSTDKDPLGGSTIRTFRCSTVKERERRGEGSTVKGEDAPGRARLTGEDAPGRARLTGEDAPGRARLTGEDAPGRARLTGEDAPGRARPLRERKELSSSTSLPRVEYFQVRRNYRNIVAN